jgi:hypothetical protein
MSNVIDTLFQSLEDTLESSIKDVETAGKSADRIADGVEEIMSSFDEHEVRAHAYLPPRHSKMRLNSNLQKAAWCSSIKAIRQQLRHGLDHIMDQLMKADESGEVMHGLKVDRADSDL